MALKKYVKGSMVPGTTYPGSRNELSAQLDLFYSKASVRAGGKVKALVVPHAGYVYSGQVAAHAFKQVEGGGYKTVFILAPSHQYPLDGVAVSNRAYYRTPLGDVAVSALAGALQKESSMIKNLPEEHLDEHTAEMQAPFLQRSLSDFEIVPLIIGKMEPAQINQLAELLIKHLGDDALIVATTDLSHYHTYDEAVVRDRSCVKAILAGNFKGAARSEMCGIYPVIALMRIAQKLKWQGKLLSYMNSGDVTNDRSAVIGFASIAFYEAGTGLKSLLSGRKTGGL